MKHFGDITKIHGDKVPIVDIITGGSPCQDLSVAGKRAGLAGERSGLFMEQIRIVKEMRNESKRRLSIQGTDYDLRHIRPRYMVWENVAGAFSSGTPKGADFRAVLEEIIKVVVKEIPDIPIPEKGWSYAGCIEGMGDDGCPFSVCYRLHDAQYWGVPQRRKRIALVADFGGNSASKILFECKSLSGDIETSREKREGTATDAERSTPQAIGFNGWQSVTSTMPILEEKIPPIEATMPPNVYCLQGNGIDRADTAGCNGKGWREKQSYTLNTIDRPAVCVVENHPADSRVKISEDGMVQTLSGRMGTGGNNVPMVMEGTYQKQVEREVVTYANEAYDKWIESEKSASLRASGGVYGGGSESLFANSEVRRLTPLECERLQGFPDHWTDIGEWTDSKAKKHKDADNPRYKSLGNSLALPFWEWMADRMCKHLREEGFEDLSMASLFDGIGGFPLVYSRCGCKPVWASEIEEFPIAVTKYHFGEE